MKKPKVIIFTALEEERDKIVTPAFKELGLCGEDAWVVVTGIGKVRATLTATKTLICAKMLFEDEAKDIPCINIGVCGGSKRAWDKAKVCRIADSVNNDFNCSTTLGEQSTKEVINLVCDDSASTCLTQDHFCTTTFDLPNDDAWYVDMELFGIASAAKSTENSLIAIKSITDIIGASRQDLQYTTNFDEACKRAADFLVKEVKEHKIISLD